MAENPEFPQVVMTLDEREINEIRHCLYYATNCAHGTVGHNLLLLCTKLAQGHGFNLAYDNVSLFHVEGLELSFALPVDAVEHVSAEEWRLMMPGADDGDA